MKLRRATREEVAGLRAARQREMDLPLVPRFHANLAAEAEPFVIVETSVPRDAAPPSAAAPPVAQGSGNVEVVLGYHLLLSREHDGHVHTTLIELGLEAGQRDRYEDVLDLIKEEAKPAAYLVRTDDCILNATLLARGLQVEASALILVPRERPTTASDEHDAPVGAGPGAAAPQATRLELARLRPSHVAPIAALLEPEESEGEEPPEHHHHGPTAAETVAQIRGMAAAEEGWVLLVDGLPQAVVAHLESEDGGYRLLDFVLAQGEETWLAWAFARATEAVWAAGRKPAAVIDALDPVRRRILRAAGWHTAAAYMVFYDPLAGRPSVPSVGLHELQDMIRHKERFHLVDVMGEEHWRAGHLPGSEWIDFRGLGREARRRYKQDDTIVVYCNGFT